MSRVFVLGHRGMLGHMVAKHLVEVGFEVCTSDARYHGGPTANEPLLKDIRASQSDWVINALGAIPQKVEDPGVLYRTNAQFPVHLLQSLGPGQRLIHASSDCVFSGMRGAYRTHDERDAESVYGLSKALGEVVALDPRVLCVRVSIVGPELGDGRGLLGWFLRQRHSVSGYVNHFWNGITTLEWARMAVEVIRGDAPQNSGLLQAGVEDPVSKCALLELFAKSLSHPVEVCPTEAPSRVDRTLVPDWVRKPLIEQLADMRPLMIPGRPTEPPVPNS